MEGKIRITVIATGFDHATPLRHMAGQMAARPVVMSQSSQSANRELPDRQPVRESARVEAPPARTAQAGNERDTFRFNDIDIPAFLRKRQ
jgi:hypothetical protein